MEFIFHNSIMGFSCWLWCKAPLMSLEVKFTRNNGQGFAKGVGVSEELINTAEINMR